MSNESVIDLFEKVYEEFGQFAVIEFARYLDENNQLNNLTWKDCNGCEYESPFINNACLVCGGN
jgi:hypothetical protein